jgi:hypothetical protein
MGHAGVTASKKRPIHGVAINDAAYVTQTRAGACPIYMRWRQVLRRTLNPLEPSFGRSKICDEWLRFSGFEPWMRQQRWVGLELDKDILGNGDRVYSPKNCAFVPQYLNQIINCIKPKSPGDCLIGTRKNRSGRFEAKCNVGSSQAKFIGTYDTAELAHRAWQNEKVTQIELAVNRYASEMFFRSDVAEALMNRAWLIRLQILRGEITHAI